MGRRDISPVMGANPSHLPASLRLPETEESFPGEDHVAASQGNANFHNFRDAIKRTLSRILWRFKIKAYPPVKSVIISRARPLISRHNIRQSFRMIHSIVIRSAKSSQMGIEDQRYRFVGWVRMMCWLAITSSGRVRTWSSV